MAVILHPLRRAAFTRGQVNQISLLQNCHQQGILAGAGAHQQPEVMVVSRLTGVSLQRGKEIICAKWGKTKPRQLSIQRQGVEVLDDCNAFMKTVEKKFKQNQYRKLLLVQREARVWDVASTTQKRLQFQKQAQALEELWLSEKKKKIQFQEAKVLNTVSIETENQSRFRFQEAKVLDEV